MKRIFISFPYTHPEKEITLERIRIARSYCLQLLKDGHCPFSPATFGHDLMHQLELKEDEMDLSFNYWEELCYAYLEPCHELHVLMIDGWEESNGVYGEINKANYIGKKVIYINYDVETKTFKPKTSE